MDKRLQIIINGCVQGVGFRPHIRRIATALELSGWVRNNGAGVIIEAQGKFTEQLIPNLLKGLPALAKISDIKTAIIPLNSDELGFNIIESESGEIKTYLPPDVAICDLCLQELFDENSRFYQYPFINCIHCGPRLTISHQLPYDRINTSMQEFIFCSACETDYSDPTNRRYHAQPIACSTCGPQLSVPMEAIAKAIASGKIVAIKSLGGYQLICDASNQLIVKQLRNRKQRETKPFAIMLANLSAVNDKFYCGEIQQELLSSTKRPIVLLKKRHCDFLHDIAPGLAYLGVMLPYTALHYLLFHALKTENNALVVTSANPRGNPILIDDKLALTELEGIADLIVSYNRKIVTRIDDSVIKVIHNKPFFIRRARGYVPEPIKLPYALPPTLAVGGHLKNTFCIIRDDEAFLSQHIGDMKNTATIEFFHESLNHLLHFLQVTPEIVAHDLHPDFYTTKFAQQFPASIVGVQHHHAHLAAVAAEHHLQQPALGLALDGYGYGYGTDGASWGGELFLMQGINFQRLGCFLPICQPGGDIAAKEPWRMAASILYSLNRKDEIDKRFAAKADINLFIQMLNKKINSSFTSSCGRFFDAASALLNVHQDRQYEGEAAMKLESLVTSPEELPGSWIIADDKFSLLPTFEVLLQCNARQGANIFHGALIAGLTDWIQSWSQKLKINHIILSGGCFLNQVLTEGMITKLINLNLNPLLPKQVPVNDAGISLGQAWIAGNYGKKSVCV